MSDYINRQEIVDYIKQNGFVYATTLETWPAADVREVVRGEWIPCYELQNVLRDDCTITGEKIFVGYKCSLCGRTEQRMEPFCNCGADMRGSGK